MTNLKRFKNNENQIWLNVASSIYVLENFVNLDNHVFIGISRFYGLAKALLPKKYHEWLTSYHEARKKAILVKHDCRKALKFPDASVDHILCSHFLEHVFPEDRNNILNDFMRVMKPGATLHIILPDIEKLVRLYNEKKNEGIASAADDLVADSLLSKQAKGTLKYRILEFSGGFGLQHRWMYDKASISAIVQKMGFEIIPLTVSSPSYTFRLNDDSVHVLCKKK